MQHPVEGFRVSSNRDEMDIDAVHDFLSSSYWAKGISKELLTKAINNSLCFGVFHTTGFQVGFARMISDYATYAYLADVYVVENYRGLGLSKLLMESIASHPDLQGLRPITLATLDAHGLYEKYGFSALQKPELFMEKWNPDVYKNE